MSRVIELTQGFSAIVDDEDYERLSQHKWHYHKGYAVRSIYDAPGKHKALFMHILIMGSVNGLEIDHINGCGTDNRKSNLRRATHAQNGHNLGAQKRKTSSVYKGVSWNKGAERWVSYIVLDGEKRYLGYYETEESAALAYNKAAASLFGEFSRLNIILT